MASQQEQQMLDVQQYLSAFKIHTVFETLTTQLMLNKPKEPIEYMIRWLGDLKNDKHQDAPRVVLVMGGPGAGKGTHCARLAEHFGCDNLNVGELLRDEIQSGSKALHKLAPLLSGSNHPDELVRQCELDAILEILRKAIASKPKGRTILLDGFPLNFQHALAFEREFGEISFVLNLECSDQVLATRLHSRHSLLGHGMDSESNVAHRISTFNLKTRPIIEYYSALPGKVKTVAADKPLQEVWAEVSQIFR
eukprot:NODE_579_length_1338_cov_775.882079_g452_i0.p1 GENE.NODE_579_length_1338_cov_775.882079_g452_i0~~NODE_579_length_1338_cov_775.882079_g452_i0.p1  ORF type:complete len:251 (+),score=28.68 NODE_579_length_1338_cov_775.882079_g452_i0:88-840(+)